MIEGATFNTLWTIIDSALEDWRGNEEDQDDYDTLLSVQDAVIMECTGVDDRIDLSARLTTEQLLVLYRAVYEAGQIRNASIPPRRTVINGPHLIAQITLILDILALGASNTPEANPYADLSPAVERSYLEEILDELSGAEVLAIHGVLGYVREYFQEDVRARFREEHPNLFPNEGEEAW